jgi:hypothetical protein
MKRIISTLILIATCFSLTGCGENKVELEREISNLKIEIARLENQKKDLAETIVETAKEKGLEKYVVTFEIKQKHYSLDVSQHLKDNMNAITIQIPVDKDYYNQINIGDTIADDFRMGSLVMSGSYGSWNITVQNKEIKF